MDDLLKRANQRLRTHMTRLNELMAERDQLADAHFRYVDTMNATVRHEHAAKAIMASGDNHMEAVETQQATWATNARALRVKAALWEHIDQYLQIVPEARLEEILEVLKRLNIDATRQAVESAVRQHPKLFGIRKEGRENFYRREG